MVGFGYIFEVMVWLCLLCVFFGGLLGVFGWDVF